MEEVADVVTDVVVLHVVRRIVVQRVVQRMVVVAAEPETDGVVHRIVQPVEAVQTVFVVEVVVEVPDLDVPSERGIRLDVFEEPVGREGRFAQQVRVRSESDLVRFRLVRTRAEGVIVRPVIWRVHSHGHHGTLPGPLCP